MPSKDSSPSAARRSAFSAYYENRKAKNSLPRSGPFSEVATTVNLRGAISHVIAHFDIKSIADIGCGDWTWFKEIPLPDGVSYTGFDIIGDIIAENSRRYGNKNISFVECDAAEAELPKVDLILCRELFSFLPLSDIQQFCDRFKKSASTYLLASTLYRKPAEGAKLNQEGPLGSWKYVDLCLPPFSLGAPLMVFPGDGPYHDVGLWKLDTLRYFGRQKIQEIPAMRPKYENMEQLMASSDYRDYMNKKA
ncbi:MAG: class I SAM-dependent methyltransferase [Alphaproteobacteria bacterium]|nr:class I SAM-dependent methyltransferase [Alphaproteobacteria bacterium]